jgi:hypothetical protein
VEIALEVRIGDLGNCAIQVSYGLEPLWRVEGPIPGFVFSVICSWMSSGGSIKGIFTEAK